MYFVDWGNILHILKLIVDFATKNSFNFLSPYWKQLSIIVKAQFLSFGVLLLTNLSINLIHIFLLSIKKVDVVDETGSCILRLIDIIVII